MEEAAIAAAEAAAADKAAGITTISITASMMQPGDDKIVAARLYEILSRKREPRVEKTEPPQADITGHWDVNMEYFSGKGMHKFFIDRQDGNWVWGSHQGSLSVQKIAGTIYGDEIKLLSTYNEPGDSIPFTFAGKISGDTISGTVHMGEYLSAKFMANKHSYPDHKIPVVVPNGGRRNGNAW